MSAELKGWGEHLYVFFTFFHGSLEGIDRFSGCPAISCRALTCFLQELAFDDRVSVMLSISQEAQTDVKLTSGLVSDL